MKSPYKSKLNSKDLWLVIAEYLSPGAISYASSSQDFHLKKVCSLTGINLFNFWSLRSMSDSSSVAIALSLPLG